MTTFYSSAIATSDMRRCLIESSYRLFGSVRVYNILGLFREDEEPDNENHVVLEKIKNMDPSAFQASIFTKLAFVAGAIKVLMSLQDISFFAISAGKNLNLYRKYLTKGWSQSFGLSVSTSRSKFAQIVKFTDQALRKLLKTEHPEKIKKYILIGVSIAIFLTIISKYGFKKVVTFFKKSVKSGVKATFAFFKWFFKWVKNVTKGLISKKESES